MGNVFKFLKFLFLIFLGICNIILFFILIPLLLAYFMGLIIFEENILTNMKDQIIFLVFCYLLSVFLLWKKRKEYTRVHLLVIIGLLCFSFFVLKYSAF